MCELREMVGEGGMRGEDWVRPERAGRMLLLIDDGHDSCIGQLARWPNGQWAASAVAVRGAEGGMVLQDAAGRRGG